MMQWIVVGFQSVANDKNNVEYDASFYIAFPTSYYSQQQVNQMIQNEINKFYQLHKNGNIVKQVKRLIVL